VSAIWRWNARRLFRLRTLPWLLSVLALVLVLRTVPLADILVILRRLRGWEIAVLIAANTLIVLLLGGRWWLLLSSLGWRLSYLRLSSYRLAAFAITYLTPGPQIGGEPLQVHLLRQRHQVSGATATASVALDKSLDLLVNFGFLVLGAVVITRLQVDFQLRPAILLALAIGLLALPLAYLAASWLGIRPFTALFLHWPAGDRSLRYQKLLRLVQEAEAQVSDFYRQRPRTLVLALLFAVVTWVAMVGEYWLAARFLGLPYTLWQAIAALTAARFAFLLPLPAGLGVLEASQAFAAAALGYDPAAGAALALLIRARDVVLALLGAWLAARYLAESRPSPSAP